MQQPPYQQPPMYQPPPPQPQYYPANTFNQIPTVGNYLVVQLLAMIPFVGLILMIIWAVGGNGTPMWKSNYARAFLIMMAIGVGVVIFLSIVFGAVFASLFSGVFKSSSYYW